MTMQQDACTSTTLRRVTIIAVQAYNKKLCKYIAFMITDAAYCLLHPRSLQLAFRIRQFPSVRFTRHFSRPAARFTKAVVFNSAYYFALANKRALAAFLRKMQSVD